MAPGAWIAALGFCAAASVAILLWLRAQPEEAAPELAPTPVSSGEGS